MTTIRSAERHRLDLVMGDIDHVFFLTVWRIKAQARAPHLAAQFGIQVPESGSFEQKRPAPRQSAPAHSNPLALPARQFARACDFR